MEFVSPREFSGCRQMNKAPFKFAEEMKDFPPLGQPGEKLSFFVQCPEFGIQVFTDRQREIYAAWWEYLGHTNITSGAL